MNFLLFLVLNTKALKISLFFFFLREIMFCFQFVNKQHRFPFSVLLVIWVGTLMFPVRLHLKEKRKKVC